MADRDFNFLIEETAKELDIDVEIVRKEIMDNYYPIFKKELYKLEYYGYDFFFIGKLIPMIGPLDKIRKKVKFSKPHLYEKFTRYIEYARDVRKNKIWKSGKQNNKNK